MSKHTPGPWKINFSYLNGAISRWHIAGPTHGSCYPICEHVLEFEPSHDEQFANAHLIAAAPDLLEALELIAGAQEMADKFTHALDIVTRYQEIAQAAIAKARGEA